MAVQVFPRLSPSPPRPVEAPPYGTPRSSRPSARTPRSTRAPFDSFPQGALRAKRNYPHLFSCPLSTYQQFSADASPTMRAFEAPQGIEYTVMHRSTADDNSRNSFASHVTKSAWRPHNQSEADSVIFGRDLDLSNTTARLGTMPAHPGAQDKISGLGQRAHTANGTYASHAQVTISPSTVSMSYGSLTRDPRPSSRVAY